MCIIDSMNKELTVLQVNLLRLAQTRDINSLSLRKIGELLGGEHPYSIQLARKALIRDGRLIYNARTGKVTLPTSQFTKNSLISIPVLGAVSCGIAAELANDGPREFLTVSPSLVDTKRWDDIFALVAAGDSMNQASIHGQTVDDGDYVIVRKADWSRVKEKDYVVSRIDDAYNLKKLHIDNNSQRIVLLSESSEPYSPIFIAEEDKDYYDIEGIAIDVVKAPTI